MTDMYPPEDDSGSETETNTASDDAKNTTSEDTSADVSSTASTGVTESTGQSARVDASASGQTAGDAAGSVRQELPEAALALLDNGPVGSWGEEQFRELRKLVALLAAGGITALVMTPEVAVPPAYHEFVWSTVSALLAYGGGRDVAKDVKALAAHRRGK